MGALGFMGVIIFLIFFYDRCLLKRLCVASIVASKKHYKGGYIFDPWFGVHIARELFSVEFVHEDEIISCCVEESLYDSFEAGDIISVEIGISRIGKSIMTYSIHKEEKNEKVF